MEARPALLPKRKAALDFEAFFRSEYPTLVRTLFLVTGNSVEAEEIAQEALARAFERWERVRKMESPGGYVCRTALNLNRKRVRHLAVRARRTPGPSSGGDHITSVEVRSDVARALATLPIGQREALVLTEWLDLTAEEAGGILGIAAASVRSQASRARAALKHRLEERDD